MKTLQEIDVELREFYSRNKQGVGGGYGMRLIESYVQSKVDELQNVAHQLVSEKVDLSIEIQRLEKEVETLRAENLKTCPCKQDGEAIKNSTVE